MRAKSPEYVSGPAMKPQTQSGSQAVTATGFDPVIGGSNPPPAAKFTAVPCDAGITTSPQYGEMSAISISPHQHGTAVSKQRARITQARERPLEQRNDVTQNGRCTPAQARQCVRARNGALSTDGNGAGL